MPCILGQISGNFFLISSAPGEEIWALWGEDGQGVCLDVEAAGGLQFRLSLRVAGGAPRSWVRLCGMWGEGRSPGLTV